MKWMEEKCKEEAGLTLVEILISIFILSLVIISASAAFIYSTKTSGEQQIRLTAINLANERMEHIRSLEFADIGTRRLTPTGYIAGNPAGLILQEETKVVNGIQYLVQTNITWEEQATWALNKSAEWDYKTARITVTPIGYESGGRLAQSLESYITRDWAHPALKGSHIQFRAVEGWRLDENITPIFGVNALLQAGPSAPSLVQSSTKGVGSFLELTQGNYRVILDDSSMGYMILPGSHIWDVVLNTDTTEREEFYYANPCGITFTLKLLSNDFITQSQISEGGVGKITINAPYPTGAVIEKTVQRTDVNAGGMISNTLFGDLWPVGDGYSGSYGINYVSLDGYQYIGYYINQGGMEIPWDGKFVNQGTVQDIILYFTQAPVMPGDIDTNWVEDSGAIIPGDYHYAVDGEGNAKSGAKFITDDVTKTLVAHEGTIGHYNSLRIYIENVGIGSYPGLLIKKNSKINLRSGEIVLRGNTILEDGSGNSGGKIILHTTWENGQDVSIFQGNQISDERANVGKAYGKIYLDAPMFLDSNKILGEGGYYFPNGAVLPDNASELIPFSKENYIG